MSTNTLSPAPVPPLATDLLDCFRTVRGLTLEICAPLETEDYVVQSMPDASPVKWHLAHTTWFFENFVLVPFLPGYRLFQPQFGFLFNSYYEAVGPRWPRSQRGILTRPTVEQILHYRAYVDDQMNQLLEAQDFDADIATRVRLGLNHEQQHQELIVTDLKHAWAANPFHPVYKEPLPRETGASAAPAWKSFPEGIRAIGHGGAGFAFDNETPRHRVLLQGFDIATRLVSNGEFLAFISDGGYDRPDLWLSDGWAVKQSERWRAPLYWEADGKDWSVMTLRGTNPLCLAEPVCHVSLYEADAFARWAGARLPTEQEWEAAAGDSPRGHFLESGRLHPAAIPAADDCGPLFQLHGDVWQWTASPYVGYPGYRPAPGALGEYNGKFMCNQFVLRGASCATPRSHARRTYRNFFPPEARWQFSGIRLAKDQGSLP
jgi:ergothioneine biosynthesis protein EgtB